jgi:AraC-like DNA-binding protein
MSRLRVRWPGKSPAGTPSTVIATTTTSSCTSAQVFWRYRPPPAAGSYLVTAPSGCRRERGMSTGSTDQAASTPWAFPPLSHRGPNTIRPSSPYPHFYASSSSCVPIPRSRAQRSAACEQSSAISSSTPYKDPRLTEACALVRGNLDRRITLADLAVQVGAGESTLSRLFRHELGMTYPQWRTNVRLLNAAVLLSDGAPVTETAHQCGWKTTSSFIDAFRRAMGQTPGSYGAAVT